MVGYTSGIYTKQTNGYKVFASDAISAVKGGVALLWVEDHDLFEIESVRFPTPDVLTFKLVTGDSKWFVVSGYIAPTDNKTGDEIRKRIDQRPDGYKTLLLGDFNASLRVPMTARDDNIADMADDVQPLRVDSPLQATGWHQGRQGRQEMVVANAPSRAMGGLTARLHPRGGQGQEAILQRLLPHAKVARLRSSCHRH